MNKENETYQKIITVKAKLFQKGDQDGYVTRYYNDEDKDENGCISTSCLIGEHSIKVPFIKNDHQILSSGFGREYLVTFHDGKRKLISKSEFEKDFIQSSPLPESVEELVRDAAKVEMGVSYEPHMSQIDESFIDGAIFGAKYHQTHHSAEVERLKRLLAELADINSTSPYHQELRLRAFEALKEIEK